VPSRAALPRVVLVVGALAAVLWLLGNLRSVERVNAAAASLYQPGGVVGSPAGVSRARKLFHDARQFGPDTPLMIGEAGVLATTGSPRALPLLIDAVREEPENLEAWTLLYSVSIRSDPDLAGRARRRVLALDPGAGPQLARVDRAVRPQ